LVGSDSQRQQGLENVAGLMGKLPKRLQSVFSPRDVSVDAGQMQKLITGGILDRSADATGRNGINYLYDDVEAILRIAGGDYESLSFEEKVLVRKTIEGASPITLSTLDGTPLTFGMPMQSHLSTSLFVPKDAASAADAAFESIEKSLQLRDAMKSADGTIGYLDGMGDLSQRLRRMITDAVEEQRRIADAIAAGDPVATPKSMMKILEDSAALLGPDDPVRELVGKLKPAIEAARDGHYLLTRNALREILEEKKNDLIKLKRSSFIDEDIARGIDQLQR